MIFRKTRTDEPQTPQQAEESTPPSPQPMAEAGNDTPVPPGMAPDTEESVTVITADVVMEGNLVTSGELHLNGTIHGAVQAGRIVIQENGAVSGQIMAQEVVIYGRAIGPICGVKVHLLPGAQVEGDVLSQGIIVENGAFIDGQIRYSEDPLGEWQQAWYGEDEQVDAAVAVADADADDVVIGNERDVPPFTASQPVAEQEPPVAPYLKPVGDVETTATGRDRDETKAEDAIHANAAAKPDTEDKAATYSSKDTKDKDADSVGNEPSRS